MAKVLFLIKRRNDGDNIVDRAGIFTGVNITADCISSKQHSSKVAVVNSSNSIQGEITLFDPTHVIIEGIWVEPDLLQSLISENPNRKFCVRLHGDMDTLCSTDHALPWLSSYNCTIACHNPIQLRELRTLMAFELKWTEKQAAEKILHLPSYHAVNIPKIVLDKDRKVLDAGSFNPLNSEGNHLLQASAALRFANNSKMHLHFHVQLPQGETGDNNSTLENLQRLFHNVDSEDHLLVIHPWSPRSAWIEMCGLMDVGLAASQHPAGDQNAADMVSTGVPIVHSCATWGGSLWRADPTDSIDIAKKLSLAIELRWVNVTWHEIKLWFYNRAAGKTWKKYISS